MTDSIDVLVVGGANTDFVVRGHALPRPGTTIEGQTFLQGCGGKGANQAVGAARLGAKAAFIGRVGDDERGRVILDRLRSEGVDVSYVVRDREAETGVALCMVRDDGEKQILTAPGANCRVTPDDVAAAAACIANAKVVLVQLEVPLEAVEVAVRLGRAAGARVILDPAPAKLLGEDLLVDLHVIRPNAAEAEALTAVEVVCRKSARAAADNLIRRGVGAVVIGAPGGNLVVTDDHEMWLPHLPVEAVDATGAGDAFAAGLACSIAHGDDLPTAARFANVAAALATTKLGAQDALPHRHDVMQLLAPHRFESRAS